jgi:peptidyl-tRNA hydrolase ICT1
LSASEHRSQPQNLSSALLKLHTTILEAAHVGLVGITSEEQSKRVEGLERGEKRRMEAFKRGRKEVKGGRKFKGGGAYD